MYQHWGRVLIGTNVSERASTYSEAMGEASLRRHPSVLRPRQSSSSEDGTIRIRSMQVRWEHHAGKRRTRGRFVEQCCSGIVAQERARSLVNTKTAAADAIGGIYLDVDFSGSSWLGSSQELVNRTSQHRGCGSEIFTSMSVSKTDPTRQAVALLKYMRLCGRRQIYQCSATYRPLFYCLRTSSQAQSSQ